MIVLAWFLDNIDHGSLPAGSTAIRNDMDMNNAQYGFLGSIVFGGLAAGKYNFQTNQWYRDDNRHRSVQAHIH